MSGELGALAMGPGQSSYRMSYNEEMNRLMAEEMAPAAATPSQTPDRFRKPPPEPEPLAKRLAEAEEQTKEASRRCVERLTALLQPLEAQLGDINAALLVERVEEELTRLENANLQLASQHSEREVQAMKMSLRAQAEKYEMKLVAARTASSVRLKNQQAELEASAQKKLEEAMGELSAGGSNELAQARLRQEELRNMVDFQRVRADNAEDMLKKAQKQLDQYERRTEKIRAELEVSREADTSIRKMVGDCLGQLVSKKGTAEESAKMEESDAKPLPVVVKKLVDAAFSAKGSASKSAAYVMALTNERDKAVAELNAERGKSMAQQAILRERLELKAEQTRLLLDRQLMRQELQLADEEVGPLTAEVRSLSSKLERAEGKLASADKLTGSAAEVKKMVDSMQAEIAESREALDKALAELDITVDKNRSLTDTVKELISNFERINQERKRLQTDMDGISGPGGALGIAQRQVFELRGQLADAKRRLEESPFSPEQIAMLRVALGEVQSRQAQQIASIYQALQISSRAPLPKDLGAAAAAGGGGPSGRGGGASSEELGAGQQPWPGEAVQPQPPQPPQPPHEPIVPQPSAPRLSHGAGSLVPLAKGVSEEHRPGGAPPPTMTKDILGTGPLSGGNAPPSSPSPSRSNSRDGLPTLVAPPTAPPPMEPFAEPFDESAFDQGGEVGGWGGGADEVTSHAADVLRMVSAVRSSSGELGTLTGTVVGRLGNVGSSLQRMMREVDHVTRALENANFQIERVTDGANERIRALKEKAREERAALIRAALGSLQQLRSHLTFTLSGLKLAEPLERNLAGDMFAWRQKRSRWGVATRTGEGGVVKLDAPIEQLQHIMHSLAQRSHPLSGKPDTDHFPKGSARPATARAEQSELAPVPPRSSRPVGVTTPRTPLFGSRPISAQISASSEPPRIGALSFGLGCSDRPASATVGEHRGYRGAGSALGAGAVHASPTCADGGGGGSSSGRTLLESVLASQSVDATWLAGAVSQTKHEEARRRGEGFGGSDERPSSPFGSGHPVSPPVAQLTPTMQRIRMERSATGVARSGSPPFVSEIGGIGAP